MDVLHGWRRSRASGKFARGPGFQVILIAAALALPAVLVQAWLAAHYSGFSKYLLLEGAIFATSCCLILALLARWQVVGRLSWIAAWSVYLLWIILVLAEAVSYSLQDDTFNARFFAHLEPRNLDTGLHGFPLLIGGGLAFLFVLGIAAAWLLRRLSRWRAPQPGKGRIVRRIAGVAALAALALLVDSTPARLAHYLVQYRRSFSFAGTPEGQHVYREINPNPVPRHFVLASPGKNLVWIYMESLERAYTDDKALPGLTPNLDRLRAHSLDFPGFETFHGAGYTMAGIFASQCGAPFYTSPFAALDPLSGNNTDKTNFQHKLACFGDVLHKAGYKQVFMGGAPISFSNKGLFFHLHGYDEALGKGELEAQYQGGLAAEGWGLYDEDLFRIAEQRYRKLARSGHPFNLTLLTLDTHPPHARPSPGCPSYPASENLVLQGVHCTDYLVGKFIDDISRDPAWKNTMVVIMSDHLRMVTEGGISRGPGRHPLLFVLNAGVTGERDTRIYHMDIAPTLLHLMGVSTNASFIAGEDRSSPRAADNPLVASRVTDSVLRKTLWQRAGDFQLCKNGVLLSELPISTFQLGGRKFKVENRGKRQVALTSDQFLAFVTMQSNAAAILLPRDRLDRQKAWRGKASLLTVAPQDGTESDGDLFSVDWVGVNGAKAHLADVEGLRGLKLSSPDCASLLRQADQAPEGQTFDFSDNFVASVEPPPTLDESGRIDFTSETAYPYEQLIGWHPATSWGSYTEGDFAQFGFRLPQQHCTEAVMTLTARPFLVPSRPKLDVSVLVNGKPVTRWHLSGSGTEPRNLSFPVRPDQDCSAIVRLIYARPGAKPEPYPKGEDPRDLQLVIYSARLQPSQDDSAQVASRP